MSLEGPAQLDTDVCPAAAAGGGVLWRGRRQALAALCGQMAGDWPVSATSSGMWFTRMSKDERQTLKPFNLNGCTYGSAALGATQARCKGFAAWGVDSINCVSL